VRVEQLEQAEALELWRTLLAAMGDATRAARRNQASKREAVTYAVRSRVTEM
jgi:hypothetical protein